MSLTLNFKGKCIGGDIDLSRFPNLTHAPHQWGEGVRTHLAGADVQELAEAAKDVAIVGNEQPLITTIDLMAEKFGVSLDELLDAIRYARSIGMV